MLRTLLNSAIAGTLLLLEDLDAAFTQSRDATGKERSLTFSGVQKERAKCIIACATMQCVSIVISVACRGLAVESARLNSNHAS